MPCPHTQTKGYSGNRLWFFFANRYRMRHVGIAFGRNCFWKERLRKPLMILFRAQISNASFHSAFARDVFQNCYKRPGFQLLNFGFLSVLSGIRLVENLHTFANTWIVYSSSALTGKNSWFKTPDSNLFYLGATPVAWSGKVFHPNLYDLPHVSFIIAVFPFRRFNRTQEELGQSHRGSSPEAWTNGFS